MRYDFTVREIPGMTRSILVSLLVLTVTAIGAAEQAVQWPSPDWSNARPEDMGLNAQKLHEARQYAESAGGSGMIVRHGKVVLRWGDLSERYDIKSATKSIGATLRRTATPLPITACCGGTMRMVNSMPSPATPTGPGDCTTV